MDIIASLVEQSTGLTGILSLFISLVFGMFYRNGINKKGNLASCIGWAIMGLGYIFVQWGNEWAAINFRSILRIVIVTMAASTLYSQFTVYRDFKHIITQQWKTKP